MTLAFFITKVWNASVKIKDYRISLEILMEQTKGHWIVEQIYIETP